jgi:hypothetical protein
MNSGIPGFGCPGVVFFLTEFPLRQQKSVSFTFRCALIFVDTYAYTLFLEVNSIFQLVSEQVHSV